jgi:hypothetical protein
MKQVKLLSVGDLVEITEEGALAHQRHHDDHVDVVTKVSTPFVKTAVETAKQIVFTFPEPGFKGTIVEVRRRWWGQSNYDYLVRWDERSGQSWHLSKHLLIE